ncbi:hypothetical protein [Rubritalea sp.]|uniref:hypothetical protein n=1 Tax=Rubritalea sp. TaxID=2109375 RepID=UPI003EF1294C
MMQSPVESKTLVQLVSLVGKGARVSMVPLLVLICVSATVTLAACAYCYWGMEWSFWWSLSPVYLMFAPFSGLLFYWFSLDGMSRLPETLLESKEILAVLKERYAQRKLGKEIRGIGPIATTRRMLLLGGLLWDSRDVIDAASNLYGLIDLFNPFFWIVMLTSCVLSVLFSVGYCATGLVHFFFF